MRERVLRRVRLREDLKPVQIYMGDPLAPINPDGVAVTHATDGNNESFNLVFFHFNGTPITWEQFETLEIAVDQAHSIVGIDHSEWESCNVEILNEDGTIAWADISN